MEIAGNIMVVVTTVLAWAFVVLYHVKAPWWRSEIGRHVMTYSTVVAAVLTLATVRLFSGASLDDTPWFAALRLVVFAGVPAAIGWRIAILWRVQRRNRSPR